MIGPLPYLANHRPHRRGHSSEISTVLVACRELVDRFIVFSAGRPAGSRGFRGRTHPGSWFAGIDLRRVKPGRERLFGKSRGAHGSLYRDACGRSVLQRTDANRLITRASNCQLYKRANAPTASRQFVTVARILGKVQRQLESKMVRSASLSALPSAYNDFLYAPIGEDTNGALLTVLSVLARRNVDPWEEAADLSRLPRDTAARKLMSMITASPALSSTLAGQTAVADRLIALLPDHMASADGTPAALPDLPPIRRSPPTRKLMLIAIYIGVMLLGQWIAASIFERAPVDVASAPSPRSTLRETLPSTAGDDKTIPSPR
jgi:hypothetical protein